MEPITVNIDKSHAVRITIAETKESQNKKQIRVDDSRVKDEPIFASQVTQELAYKAIVENKRTSLPFGTDRIDWYIYDEEYDDQHNARTDDDLSKAFIEVDIGGDFLYDEPKRAYIGDWVVTIGDHCCKYEVYGDEEFRRKFS